MKILMNQTMKLFSFAISLFFILQDTSADIECLPGNDSCSQCYAALVRQVTKNDSNQFQVQKTFFPPDRASPSFVTVFYDYYKDGELLPIKTDPWFWSTSTFYLHHPLHAFQFTSLLFSDLSISTAEIHIKLDVDCLDANEDHMRLLTQRLKIHATRKSIFSPISDTYGPKAETATTIKKWQNNNSDSSHYISSTFYVFPFLTIPLLLLAVFYFNDLAKHSRINQIKNVFKSKFKKKERFLKYQLQNEFVMSQIFVVFTIVLATLGVVYTINTEEHLNREITEYFNLQGETVTSRHSTSLPIMALVLDVITIPLQIVVAVSCFRLTSKTKVGQIQRMWMWRYCAYSIAFPLWCAANHLNYIIIAFIHDAHHATGVAIAYGITIFFLYAALMQLSHFLDKYQLDQSENEGNFKQKDDTGISPWIRRQRSKHFMTWQLIIKVVLVLLLIGYLLYDFLLFQILPFNEGFDNATNNLLSLYQTIAVFFAAIAAYFFLNKPFRSPISILTKAQDKQKVFDIQVGENKEWEDMTSSERDILIAKEILHVLNHLKKLPLNKDTTD